MAAQLFPDYSRSRLQAWIKAGELQVDGRQCRPRDKVTSGAVLLLEAELREETAWEPQAIELDVLYEDDSILVLNKPAGLVVHPAAGHADGTLVNALLARVPELAQLPRGGIVHRLDMDTSGVMVVARDLAAHHNLVEQLQARSVKREYCAVCIGAMTGGGTIDAPIGRHPRQRKRMAVLPAGGQACRDPLQDCAAIRPPHPASGSTWRPDATHQIRVHMAHRHYPLVGDPVYGGRPRIPAGASAALVEALRGFPRQALHAQVLGLVHPRSGEELRFEAPSRRIWQRYCRAGTGGSAA